MHTDMKSDPIFACRYTGNWDIVVLQRASCCPEATDVDSVTAAKNYPNETSQFHIQTDEYRQDQQDLFM